MGSQRECKRNTQQFCFAPKGPHCAALQESPSPGCFKTEKQCKHSINSQNFCFAPKGPHCAALQESPSPGCFKTEKQCKHSIKHNKCNYQCPAFSSRKSNRKCYDNFDDCKCIFGFKKRFGKCVLSFMPSHGKSCYRHSTGKSVPNQTVVDCVQPAGKKCRCDDGQWTSFGYAPLAAIQQ